MDAVTKKFSEAFSKQSQSSVNTEQLGQVLKVRLRYNLRENNPPVPVCPPGLRPPALLEMSRLHICGWRQDGDCDSPPAHQDLAPTPPVLSRRRGPVCGLPDPGDQELPPTRGFRASHSGRGGHPPRPPLPEGGHRVPLPLRAHCDSQDIL